MGLEKLKRDDLVFIFFVKNWQPFENKLSYFKAKNCESYNYKQTYYSYMSISNLKSYSPSKS